MVGTDGITPSDSQPIRGVGGPGKTNKINPFIGSDEVPQFAALPPIVKNAIKKLVLSKNPALKLNMQAQVLEEGFGIFSPDRGTQA